MSELASKRSYKKIYDYYLDHVFKFESALKAKGFTEDGLFHLRMMKTYLKEALIRYEEGLKEAKAEEAKAEEAKAEEAKNQPVQFVSHDPEAFPRETIS